MLLFNTKTYKNKKMKKILLLLTLLFIGDVVHAQYDFTEQDGPELVKLYQSKARGVDFQKEYSVDSNGDSIVFSKGPTHEYMLHVDEGYINLQSRLKESKKKDGLFLSFFENGNIHRKVLYLDGKRDGVETTFFPEGDIRSMITFKKGKLIQETHYERLIEVDAKDIVLLALAIKERKKKEIKNLGDTFRKKYKVGEFIINKKKDLDLTYTQADNDTVVFKVTFHVSGKEIVITSYSRDENALPNGFAYFYNLDPVYLSRKSFWIKGNKKGPDIEFSPEDI